MPYFDLGTHTQPVRTTSRRAQRWFDRGMIWCYGFNHEEAVVCFHKALTHDPHLAMAHWGIAHASGPNYNLGWHHVTPEARVAMLETVHRHLDLALSLADGAVACERALIGALVTRHPADASIEDYAPYHAAYADAMRSVHAAFPDDLNVIALFAEAMLNRSPWLLWDIGTGTAREGTDTLEAKALMERAFDERPDAWDHPGLLHMYIHLMEMSPTPEAALRHGDRLTALVPESGHLIHMPTHIDVLTGAYQSAVERNLKASVADEKFLAHAGADNFYTLYRAHNYSFTLYAAMFLGQKHTALRAADNIIRILPEDVLRKYADWTEASIPKKQHVMIRFGMWDEILAQPMPGDPDLYCMTTAIMHYAKAIACANTGGNPAAHEKAFQAARGRVPDTRLLFNNTCVDLLKIAEQMMLGEIAYHAGRHTAAFDHLRAAVILDDGLLYDEPWGWMQPARHALGALLLEQGQCDEAEAIYRADLGLDTTLPRPCQHPGNVWSLHGLHECLTRRGETAESAHIHAQLKRAMARADVDIRGSCYCRGQKVPA